MAFDEAAELGAHMRIPEDFSGGTHAVIALQFLTSDIEQADTGRGQPQRHAREGIAHDGEFHQIARITLHIGAKVQQHHIAARGGANRRQRRAINFRHGLDDNLGQRHQRPGIAGGHNARSFASRHRINGKAHGRTAHAQRRRWLQIT